MKVVLVIIFIVVLALLGIYFILNPMGIFDLIIE
ncbi:hypothetical protein SAMN05216565_10344 [Litchfieldia salsa]|uniref:Uncharacterized protein n=1 Tax=Litchfieldia salsa TaxID=930152 RepID=A0A1H0SNQ5_9BACI|nr:hypothetical protein SAMN05216565_10344 [Litchfieldia salsa]